MITVKIYGGKEARGIIGTLTGQALRDAGLKVGVWMNVPPNDENESHYADAKRRKEDVLILEMTSQVAD